MGIWQAVWLICLGLGVGSPAVDGKRSRQLFFSDDPGKAPSSATTASSDDVDGELPSEIPCAHRNQCGGGRHARLPFHARNCFCDSSCRAYGDCCRDYSPADDPSTADRGPIIPHSIRGIVSCRRVEEIDTGFEMYIVDSCPRGHSDRFVVDKCENELTPGLFYRLPVTGRTTGVLYRNVYCAACAGDADVVYWEMAYRCSEADWLSNGTLRRIETVAEFRRLTNHLRCPVEMIPPMGKRPRKCKSNIDRCPRKWRDERVAAKCKGVTAYVYHGLQVFKNKHCAICNNIDEAVVQCDDTRTPWPDLDSRLEEGEASEATSSSVYVVFDTNTGSGIVRRTAASTSGREHADRRPHRPDGGPVVVKLGECSEGSVYDVFADTCRFLGCRDGKCSQAADNQSTTVSLDVSETATVEATARKTAGMPTSTVVITSSRTAAMRRPTSTTGSTFLELNKYFKTSTAAANARTAYNKMAKTHTSIAVTEPTTRDRNHRSRSKTTFRSTTRRRITPKIATTPTTSAMPATTPATAFVVPTIIASSATTTATSSASTLTSTTTSTMQTSTTTVSTARATNTTTTISIPSTIAAATTSGEAFVLIIPISTVSVSPASQVKVTGKTYDDSVKVTSSIRGNQMKINSKEVKLAVPFTLATTPVVRSTGKAAVTMLPEMNRGNLEGEMEMSDREAMDGESDSGGTRNCSDILVMFKFDRMQSLVSFVGTLTSLVSLLISFVAILVLPSMRGTIRGKVLLSLILSLFAAQLLYLVALPSNQPFATRIVCYWIGTVLHYCVLAVFFWVSVLAIDTAMNIMGSQRELEACESWGRVFGYSLYAWLTPAVIVAACLTAEALEADQVLIRPCYGEGVCWVTGRFALLLAVALPAGVLTLVSLFLYFLSASHMCVNVTYKDLKTKRNRIPDGRRLALCVCLTILVALTWTSGFVATFTRLHSVWWAFIGFSTFQGNFICVAFVCTRKIFQRLRDRGRSGKGSSSTNWSYQKDRGPSTVDGTTSAKRQLPGAESEIVLHETSM